MKKLNRKGFTLIELLAVIVIMAIIVVVTVPTIINTIADARVNSLWNLAKSTANTYDNLVAQDMIASEKVLKDITLKDSWTCIGTLKNDKDVQLADILDLSTNDVNLSGQPLTTITQFNDDITSDELVNKLTGSMCSSIRVRNGKIEILLIAKSEGKFAVSGKVVYALSSHDKGGTK